MIVMYYSAVFILTNEFEHEKYLFNLSLTLYFLIKCIYFTKKNNDVVMEYLKKLEYKYEEVHSFKKLVDNLKEGIFLVNKKFEIIYKNNTVDKIFGFKASLSKLK